MKKVLSVIIMLAAIACLAGCESSRTISEGGALKISVNEVNETAEFYPVTVDGTSMEVLAVKDSGGNIRTAFNTCQSCYTSGNGRYEVEGTDLVCQNCGFHLGRC